MSFETVAFESNIRYEFQLETDRSKPRILIAKFIGTYRPGSSGAPDACFIIGITTAACEMWGPSALILDFRQLSYVWGDEMDWLLGDFGETMRRPTAIVGSELCLPAIGTLLYDETSTIPATDAENIFDNLDEAITYLHSRTRKQARKKIGRHKSS